LAFLPGSPRKDARRFVPELPAPFDPALGEFSVRWATCYFDRRDAWLTARERCG